MTTQAREAYKTVRKVLADAGGFRFVRADAVKFDKPTWAGIRACGGLGQMAQAPERKFVDAYDATLSIQPAVTLERGGQDSALPRGDR